MITFKQNYQFVRTYCFPQCVFILSIYQFWPSILTTSFLVPINPWVFWNTMCLVMTQFSRSMSLDVIVIRAAASLDNLGALLPGINLLQLSLLLASRKFQFSSLVSLPVRQQQCRSLILCTWQQLYDNTHGRHEKRQKFSVGEILFQRIHAKQSCAHFGSFEIIFNHFESRK